MKRCLTALTLDDKMFRVVTAFIKHITPTFTANIQMLSLLCSKSYSTASNLDIKISLFPVVRSVDFQFCMVRSCAFSATPVDFSKVVIDVRTCALGAVGDACALTTSASYTSAVVNGTPFTRLHRPSRQVIISASYSTETFCG